MSTPNPRQRGTHSCPPLEWGKGEGKFLNKLQGLFSLAFCHVYKSCCQRRDVIFCVSVFNYKNLSIINKQ